MKISIWGDYACPYCYIGETNLQKAIEELGVQDKIEYDLNAFQIDLDAPKSTKQTNAVLLAYEKAIPLVKANAAYDHAKAMDKAVDLKINEATAYNTNTMDAHRMVQWAKATYHDSKLIENLADDLFYAYFTENKELADHKVLLDVAKKNKLDTEEVKKIIWHTLDELRKVQRCEEKSEEINNELEFKKEKVEWDNLIILKDKVQELNGIEKLVFFEHLLAQKEITNLVEVAGCLRRTLQRVKKNLLVKLKNALKN